MLPETHERSERPLKRFKKIGFAAVLAAAMLTQNIYAIDYSENSETKIITVSGTLEGTGNTNLVSLDIKNENNELVYTTFIPAEGGNFSYSFKLPDLSITGAYKLIFTSLEKEEILTELYVSEEDTAAIVAALNEANNNEAVKSVFVTYKKALGISDRWLEIITGADKDAIAAALLEGKGNGYENKDIPEIKEIIRKSLCNAAFKAAQTEADVADAMEEFAAIYELDKNASLYSEYTALSEDKQKSAREIMAKNADNLSEVKGIFDVGTLLTLLSNTKQPADIINLIDNNRSLINFDLSTYDKMEKTAGAKILNGKTFNSLSGLESEISAAYKATQNPGSTNPGGGGTGGSGNKNSGPVINLPQATEPAAKPQEEKFEDLDAAAWAKTAINSLAEKGIISGMSEKSFAPLEKLTREQFAVMLVKAFGISESGAISDFSDLPESHWAYGAVSAAYKKGIVSGIGGGMFGTGQNIKRQDIAVMAAKAAETAGYSLGGDKAADLKDIEELPEYAKESVVKMVSAGIINGYPEDGTFRGAELATRAQAAQIIYTILQKGK